MHADGRMMITERRGAGGEPVVREVSAEVYVIPTDAPEADGTLFDGALDPHGGILTPDRAQPRLGLQLRAADAEPYRRG